MLATCYRTPQLKLQEDIIQHAPCITPDIHLRPRPEHPPRAIESPRTTELPTSIPPINHEIGPRSESTSTTRQIQIYPFQFSRIRIPL